MSRETIFWENFRDRPDNLNFLDLAKQLIDYLHDPYTDLSIGFPLRADNPEKLTNLTLSRFYKSTKSISFFDSIVVFQKGERAFPRSEIR